jgi:hypothetical protein
MPERVLMEQQQMRRQVVGHSMSLTELRAYLNRKLHRVAGILVTSNDP